MTPIGELISEETKKKMYKVAENFIGPLANDNADGETQSTLDKLKAWAVENKDSIVNVASNTISGGTTPDPQNLPSGGGGSEPEKKSHTWVYILVAVVILALIYYFFIRKK